MLTILSNSFHIYCQLLYTQYNSICISPSRLVCSYICPYLLEISARLVAARMAGLSLHLPLGHL